MEGVRETSGTRCDSSRRDVVTAEQRETLWKWRDWRRGTLIEDRSLAVCRMGVALWLLWSVQEWALGQGPKLLFGARQLLPSSAVMELAYSRGHFSLFFFNSSPLWHFFLFTAMAIAAAMLFFGWRTRSASVTLWLLAVSLNERFAPVMDNGDQLIRLILFFGSFSTWGRRLSLDSALAAAHGARPPSPPLWKALGNAGLLMQVLIAQVLFAATLTGATYADGSAVHRLLSLTELLGGVGHVQRVAPWAAVLYYWWLRLGPALLLVSFVRPLLQTVAVGALVFGAVLASLSFGPMLAPTFLAYACCVPCFLPAAWWTYMQDTFWSTRRKELRLFFDGFSRSSTVATVLLPVLFLLHPRTRVADGRKHGDTVAVFRTESIWWVVDDTGQQYDHVDAVPVLLDHSLVLWPLAVIYRRITLLRKVVELIYWPFYYIARRQGPEGSLARATYFGSLSASDAKLEADRHEWSEPKESIVENHFLTVITCAAIVLLLCCGIALFTGARLPPSLAEPIHLLRLDQEWADPLLSGDRGNPWKWDFYWTAPGLLSDMTLVDMLLDFPDGIPFNRRVDVVKEHPREALQLQQDVSDGPGEETVVVNWSDEEWKTGMRSSQPSLRGYSDTPLTWDRRLVRYQLHFMERMRHKGTDEGLGHVSLFYIGDSVCSFWNREKHRQLLERVEVLLNSGVPLTEILEGHSKEDVENVEKRLEEMRGNPFDMGELVLPMDSHGEQPLGLRFVELVAVVKDVVLRGEASVYSMWLHSCSPDSAPDEWIHLHF